MNAHVCMKAQVDSASTLPYVDPHPVWMQRWREIQARIEVIYDAHAGRDPDTPEYRALIAERADLDLKISKTQVETCEGAQAQFAWLDEVADGMDGICSEADLPALLSLKAFVDCLDNRRREVLYDADFALLKKIKTTQPRTVEGALLQIEVIDRDEIEGIPYETICEPDRINLEARAMALATVRKRLSRMASETDPHHAWIDRYWSLDRDDLGDAADQQELLKQISTTPPRTVAGALAMLRFWHQMALAEVTLHTGEMPEGHWTGDFNLKAGEIVFDFLDQTLGH